MTPDEYARAWRAHQRDLRLERRVFWAFARGVVITAFAMTALFVYALFGA